MKNNITILHFKRVALFTLIALCIFFNATNLVSAQLSGSAYRVEEVQVGAVSGDSDLTSTSFRGRAGVGDTAVGIVNGTTYQAVGGFVTSDVPELEVIAGALNLNLGNASTSTTLTGTSQFGVRAYLTGGYVVIVRGAPPTQESGGQINALATQTASSVGTEQFGINLVANTVPTTFGSNPSQVPNSTFSFGFVETNYATANQYRYVNGDTIARSNSSSGVTNYTISYIVNIRATTRSGLYNYNHSVNVVGTY